MLTYLAGLCSSTLSVIFIVFIIGALGFMLGGINVKGISLGTAGVLIVALAYGILIHYFPEFSIEAKKITLWSNSIKSSFSLISNIGTALFVTAVGLIAGPKFFRTFNKKSIAYSLIFSDGKKTLTEEEVTNTMEKIVEVVTKKCNAEVRNG